MTSALQICKAALEEIAVIPCDCGYQNCGNERPHAARKARAALEAAAKVGDDDAAPAADGWRQMVASIRTTTNAIYKSMKQQPINSESRIRLSHRVAERLAVIKEIDAYLRGAG